MTIRHLNIFIAVAECGSMSAAAQKLYLSQPTVSQAIRELEDHYQIQLFERYCRRLYITEDGKQLLSLAHQLIDQYTNLEELMQKKSQASSIRIGSSITVGTCLMPDVIHDMEMLMPQIHIYSCVNNTHEIEKKLLRAELDAAVVEGNIDSQDLLSFPIIQDGLVLACGKNHPFYKEDTISAAQLVGQRFAIREEGSGTRKLFEQYLMEQDIRIEVFCEANCPRTILNGVLKNNALAVMSARLMKHEIAKGYIKIFKLEENRWNRDFKMVYHKNKFITPEMKLLENTLKQYENFTYHENCICGTLK